MRLAFYRNKKKLLFKNKPQMSQLPGDFNWKAYLALNPDLRPNGIVNEEKAKRHWRMHGSREKRPFSIKHITTDFSWEAYRDANADLVRNGLTTEQDFLGHWIHQGIEEQRPPYFPIKNEVPSSSIQNSHHVQLHEEKKLLILLSHGLGGGLSKYVKDLILKFPILCHRSEEYQIITNERGTSGTYQDGNSIIKLLESDRNGTILHINIFTENYKKWKIDQILNILTQFRSKEGNRLVITIHDYFWLWCDTPNLTNDIFETKRTNPIQIVTQIFQMADLVIFPTNFAKDRFCEKGLNLVDINYVVEKHCDYYYCDIDPYYQRVDEKIRILFLGSFVPYKGSQHVKRFIEKALSDEREQIEFHILGAVGPDRLKKDQKIYEHGAYTNDNVFAKINEIKPHLLLMSSAFYETYSYVASILMKTGLPIFYNQRVYQERLHHRLRTNIYPYNSNDSTEKVVEDLFLVCQDLRKMPSKDYLPLEEKPDLYVTGFYENLYGRIEEKGINRTEKGLINSRRIDHQTRLETLYLESKDQYQEIHQKIRPFAIYFPQFHRVEENNYNFYPGYTDMINLRQLKRNKNYSTGGHLLTPLDDWLGYYDLLLDDDLIDRQILTAKAHGIYGFAMYHYWFTENTKFPDKHKVMHKVVEKIFSRQHDFNFYLIWANENWERSNSLTNTDTLKLRQDYKNEDDIRAHFEYLLPFFQHPNYYRVDGKPVLFLHHPWLINLADLDRLILRFNTLSQENGLPGIYLMINGMIPTTGKYPPYYMHSNYKTNKSHIRSEGNRTYFDYRKYMSDLYDKSSTKGVLSVFSGFDNGARLLNAPNITRSIFVNDTVENFTIFLDHQFYRYELVENESKIFLINAWNEWGENMVIEPSNERQFSSLETIRNSLIKYFGPSLPISEPSSSDPSA
jgi:glycosyltransferase involved in cell wall biosynthesis